MKEQLEKIEALAKQELNECADIKALDDLRVKFLGKKGELTAILKQMGKLSAEERPVMGQLANKVRADIEEALASKLTALKSAAQAARLKEETIDVTLPGTHAPLRSLTVLRSTTTTTFSRHLTSPKITLQEILRILSTSTALTRLTCSELRLPLYRFTLWKTRSPLSVSSLPDVFSVLTLLMLLTLPCSTRSRDLLSTRASQ